MPAKFIKEACVETLSQAISAQERGATRIELCSYLEYGGLTPSFSLVKEVLTQVAIPVRVMIRPRGGDFIYNEEEIIYMKQCIKKMSDIGIEGVVYGVLDKKEELNLNAIQALIKASQGLSIVIHKAIDAVKNPLKAVQQLCAIEGVTTILSSGGDSTAFEGKEVLKQMLQIADGSIEIMPAGKITNINVLELHNYLGAQAYHGRKIVGELDN